MEWEKRLDLFQVAVMPEYPISITEMTRQVTEQQPRVRSLMVYLDEDPAIKKVVSAMYLSLGEAARKQFRDQFPHKTVGIKNIKTGELIQMCNDCFLKKRHQFFSSMQQPGETLYQFWLALNGLAATCDFREITTTLVLDMFILHMNNKQVQ